MKQHELKCDPLPFFPLFQNHKRAELRVNDRDFKEGDCLYLRETRYSSLEMRVHGKPLEYTGRFCYRIITHIFPLELIIPGDRGELYSELTQQSFALLSIRPRTKAETERAKGEKLSG